MLRKFVIQFLYPSRQQEFTKNLSRHQ